MNLNTSKSNKKLYYKIRNKIKNRFFLNIVEDIIIKILIMLYFFKITFCKSKDNAKADFKDYKPIENDENNNLLKINGSRKYDISILVPVYNVEQYLENCINSLVNQKTKYSYEIVFVNDGSTDNSWDILKKYENFDNITIINQENKGLSETRNVLISNANGKYVLFVDSDDLLEENAIDKMGTEAFENFFDLVQCSYYKFFENEKSNIVFKERTIIDNKYDNLQIPGFAWGKLIKIDLFENIRFPKGYLYEDTIIPFLVLSKCNNIKILSDCFYGYRINENGIVNNSKNNIKCCDTVFIFDQIFNQMKRNNINIDYDIVKFMLNCQFSYVTYERIQEMDIEIQKAVFEKICDYFQNLNISINKKESCFTKNIEKSIKTRNFKLWFETSKIIKYKNWRKNNESRCNYKTCCS